MTDDLISRQETLATFWKSEVEFRPSQIDEVERIIKSVPTVEAEPVRHGRAVFKYMWGRERVECSLCGYRYARSDGDIHNYCPNCGAKMDAERKEE